MICEICGSQSIRKENGVFVCQECGTEYSLEEAKNLLKEIDGDSGETAQTNPLPIKAESKQVEISKSYEKSKNEVLYYLLLWLDTLSQFTEAKFWCGEDSHGNIDEDYVNKVLNSKKIDIPLMDDSLFYRDHSLDELRLYRFYDALSLSKDTHYDFFADSNVKELFSKFNKDVRYSRLYTPGVSFESSDHEYFVGPFPNGKVWSLEKALVDSGEKLDGVQFWLIYTILGHNKMLPKGTFKIEKTIIERGFFSNRYKYIDVTSNFKLDELSNYIKNKVFLYKDRHNKLVKHYNDHFEEAIEGYRALANDINELNKEFPLPNNYRRLSSISYLIDCFKNGRADSWKEAVNLLELNNSISCVASSISSVALQINALRIELAETFMHLDQHLQSISTNISTVNKKLSESNDYARQIMKDTRYSLICQILL